MIRKKIREKMGKNLKTHLHSRAFYGILQYPVIRKKIREKMGKNLKTHLHSRAFYGMLMKREKDRCICMEDNMEEKLENALAFAGILWYAYEARERQMYLHGGQHGK